MATASKLINLTPHPLVFYTEPIVTIQSSGQLRLAFKPQAEMPPFEHDGVAIPVHMGQSFTGLDETTDGWPVWLANPDAAIVVSMATAQFIAEHVMETGVGARQIYSPATDPKNSVRDIKGGLLGALSLERYV